MMNPFKILFVFASAFCYGVRAQSEAELMAAIKQAAQAAKQAPPDKRLQLQTMLQTFAKERDWDLKAILPPEDYAAIFFEEGEQEDDGNDVEEEDEEEFDPSLEWKEKIETLITEKNPKMLKKLKSMLSQWEGKEEELFNKLKAKYDA
eukprot:TRINITY_DN239_c4_g1_i1.p2 TRINITY_DN239_c4_g1~~TRINITY_DN239_c4_g1_i1.p2  ORF type:complete len:148 (+),score=48.36 TRINITY_DN239_c4_g1_i1:1040-1483(+)